MKFRHWVIVAALLSAGMANATCYRVYWADGVLATESSTAPVDLSLPLNEGLDDRFGPGVTMVISDQTLFCGTQEVVAVGRRSLADEVRAQGEGATLIGKAQVADAVTRTAAR